MRFNPKPRPSRSTKALKVALDATVERAEAAERERDEYREALKQIAYDDPNPGSRKTPELQWASDIAFNALQKRQTPR